MSATPLLHGGLPGHMWTYGWLHLRGGARLVEVLGRHQLAGHDVALCADAFTGEIHEVPVSERAGYSVVPDREFERLSGLAIPRVKARKLRASSREPLQNCYWIPRHRDPVVRGVEALGRSGALPGPWALGARARTLCGIPTLAATDVAMFDVGTDMHARLGVRASRACREGVDPVASVWECLVAVIARGFGGDVAAASRGIDGAEPGLRDRLRVLLPRVVATERAAVESEVTELRALAGARAPWVTESEQLELVAELSAEQAVASGPLTTPASDRGSFSTRRVSAAGGVHGVRPSHAVASAGPRLSGYPWRHGHVSQPTRPSESSTARRTRSGAPPL